MHTEQTIFQLDIGHVPDELAREMGELGFMQWMGGLPGDAGYIHEAVRAYEMARPFIASSPAVAVFCHLLVSSVAMSPAPLPIALPPRTRRGGAQARRMSL
ncbi:hypothetical protein [Marinibacterium profundimaris]|uniref:Uncharacterized protein n=1 Tax=Marinibacterium profundimaris TaxID=1679460 RepID=A0A225NG11_9RHOB|nr:hypothetical protein [Marinibacterium profundimaris]OWU72316.1 hypothetical protein ATO3_17420 [Marinibacterium profundimaris]